MKEHWSRQKQVGGYGGLKMLVIMLRFLPGFLLRVAAVPIGLFYYLFAGRGRRESARFLKKAAAALEREGVSLRISPFRHMFAFSLMMVEKLEGWTGKVSAARLHYQDDDVKDLTRQLEEKKGVLFICSHLGNAEFLRGVTTTRHTVVARPVPVTSIVNISVTSNFTRAMREVNPESLLNVISADAIGPDTIIQLQERIDEGGIVVIAGDRTAANTRGKYFRFPFLGEEAPFSFGPFFLAALLAAPTYCVFALRRKDLAFTPDYDVHIHKSAVSFDCPRRERDTRVENLAREFAGWLEYYCKKRPYQWYNYFDFWADEKPPHAEASEEPEKDDESA